MSRPFLGVASWVFQLICLSSCDSSSGGPISPNDTAMPNDAAMPTDAGGISPPPWCQQVECVSDADCCANVPRPCTAAACIGYKCSYGCDDESDCPSRLPFCISGTCVECSMEGDCIGSRVQCLENRCVMRCSATEPCAGGLGCVEDVCVARACDSDQACAAGAANQAAFCGPDRMCSAPCSSDMDCSGFAPLLKNATCVNGNCHEPGCATDEQCYTATQAARCLSEVRERPLIRPRLQYRRLAGPGSIHCSPGSSESYKGSKATGRERAAEFDLPNIAPNGNRHLPA
jgi:hypothetical protein